MTEPLVTKRLHVSGLTPAITATDIERRFSAFGKVKAMDGFGARDAFGDPRKFAYVTIEAKPKDLAKCVNILSGSTWKGTKIRIGEAKPDFCERIAYLNSLPLPPPRQKRVRARDHGYPSSTLPLTPLPPTAAAKTPGWIVTPSGRIIRPMKMRPDRPLEPMRTMVTKEGSKPTGNNKTKRRIKPPPVRARRRIIDPTKWDSSYLKGVFMDTVVPSSEPVGMVVTKVAEPEHEDDGTDAGEMSDEEHHHPQQMDSLRLPASPGPVINSQTRPKLRDEDTGSVNIREETNAALALLNDMFGKSDDWGGSESVDEVDETDSRALVTDEAAMAFEDDNEVEFIPRGYKSTAEHGYGAATRVEATTLSAEKRNNNYEEAQSHVVDIEMVDTNAVPSNDKSASSVRKPQDAAFVSAIKLKDLFAPREEEASFSLLSHLNVDLELDDDIAATYAAPIPASLTDHSTTSHTAQPVYISALAKPARSFPVSLNPSLPLLFPLSESLPYSSSSVSNQPSTPCILFPNHNVQAPRTLPPSSSFARSLGTTSESIREQWEKDKVALTHEWKKAWREARGSRRARGADGEDR